MVWCSNMQTVPHTTSRVAVPLARASILPSSPSDWELATVPFGPGDVTAGAENEWMAAVRGASDQVDLPCTLRESNYVRNLQRRVAAGDASPRLAAAIESYLNRQADDVWENSWVRFPMERLSALARWVLEEDLYADKSKRGDRRADADRFIVRRQGEDWLRVPISYLMKLALADSVHDADARVRVIADKVMRHFLNDNTSPETYSFHLATARQGASLGSHLAGESARRFLLAHALTQYANHAFGLLEHGQEALIYMAPQTPLRQRQLNDLVADSFYRDLFMSPCLAGWDRGEDKHQYMILCHEILSRSRLNTMAKLRECGILSRNLVTLPSVSNTSLANNGTHVTLGSRRWTEARAAGHAGAAAVDEKRAGDLVVKIVEHFLPLLVGTYSAAPGRFDFADFHPETVLGFMPHELDFTHLRMLWRRWKGKADLSRLGCTLTPFGPRRLDRSIAAVLGLRGDWVPDQRLIDYLVAPLSTDQCPALDGTLDNDQRLKRDLTEMGAFDARMVWYSLYRQRLHAVMGFCGFEGRTYSQFGSLMEDFGPAVDLQRLITALACQYVWRGELTHADIPDTPEAESERRQIFFGAAIGLPTFFINGRTGNRFLARLLARTRRVRDSHRYPGRRRVYQTAYRHALFNVLETDGAALVEALGLRDLLHDLRERIEPDSGRAVQDRLLKGILNEAGARHPLKIDATTFHTAAESYYRGPLHRRFIEEAVAVLSADLRRMGRAPAPGAHAWIHEGGGRLEDWRGLIHTLLEVVQFEARRQEQDT
jgi:hypothetical protein